SRVILPDYFETMQIPVVSGRAPDRRDDREAARVVAISQSMARRYFPDLNPIGRTFAVDAAGAQPMQIIGIVGDVMSSGIDPAPQPIFYVPYAQSPAPVMTVVMRVAGGNPAAVLGEAERIAWAISPSTNVYAIETMRTYLDDQNWRSR